MEYFARLLELLRIEKEEDRRTYEQLIHTLPAAERRAAGITWYPVAIRDTETGAGDYLTVEVERTTHHEIIHQLRFGMPAVLFSNHDSKTYREQGTITQVSVNRLRISLRTEVLPEWCCTGKLGIDAVFDENSYREMEAAIREAAARSEKKEEGHLVRILAGDQNPSFHESLSHDDGNHRASLPAELNSIQREAVQKILDAHDLAIVHGPPGTGKTTTLVHSIKALLEREKKQVLVVAPSNAAVDLLSEKLAGLGLNVVRIGNPAKVSESQMALTIDSRIASHARMKEVRRLKKQAAAYRDLAGKYKRTFGASEREQRKALFAEARNIWKEIEKTENYLIQDVLSKADVITSTLVGANHYTVRDRRYATVVIDEAGQALEPACWIPVLKADRIVMAGDHNQLPPTIRSDEAARKGLGITLLEKLVSIHPGAVIMLEEQYRMHEIIAGFSSREFYEGRLKANVAVAGHLLFPGDQPMEFIDTAGCGFEETREGTGISNREEANFLLKLLAAAAEKIQNHYNGDDLPSIGVISPYKNQVEKLRNAMAEMPGLKNYTGRISVNTIDSFQGQERDAIFISLTRSNGDSVIGFLSEVRRMNVAMTRARKKLVLVGDSATLCQFPFYADLISYTQQQNAYRSAWELIDF